MPRKRFNTFVQSVDDARRSGNENTDSRIVAETMNLRLLLAETIFG